ncbi:MAG: hypothetical protein NT052_02560 [Candidatus Shapirobacteria bacterium]|nr:hypothetical protein [Candidatus Shapirobacteria bacterium]
MKKIKLGKDILALTIFTLITISTWIGFEIWLSATESTISKATEEQMALVNSKISKDVIESLKTRNSLPESELNLIASSSGTIENQEENIATESSKEKTATGSSQNATESATLE